MIVSLILMIMYAGSSTMISYVIVCLWQTMAIYNSCLRIVHESTHGMYNQMSDSGSDRSVV
jgi:disulfide bond formation protein DsbB